MCEPAKKLPFAHLLTQTQTHEALAVHGFAPRTFCVDVCTCELRPLARPSTGRNHSSAGKGDGIGEAVACHAVARLLCQQARVRRWAFAARHSLHEPLERVASGQRLQQGVVWEETEGSESGREGMEREREWERGHGERERVGERGWREKEWERGDGERESVCVCVSVSLCPCVCLCVYVCVFCANRVYAGRASMQKQCAFNSPLPSRTFTCGSAADVMQREATAARRASVTASRWHSTAACAQHVHRAEWGWGTRVNRNKERNNKEG